MRQKTFLIRKGIIYHRNRKESLKWHLILIMDIYQTNMASWTKEVVLTANQEESWAVQLLASKTTEMNSAITVKANEISSSV